MPLYRRFFSVEGVDRKGVKGDKPNKVNVKENAKTKYYSTIPYLFAYEFGNV